MLSEDVSRHLCSFVTKRDLAAHIAWDHPAHLWPEMPGLVKWSRDELEHCHEELHGVRAR